MDVRSWGKVPEPTRCVFKQLSAIASPFYLAGGTALTLAFQHRISEDLVFFRPDRFSSLEWLHSLQNNGLHPTDANPSNQTLHCLIEGVKVSFFTYPFPMLEPLEQFQGVQIASMRDIASMKLAAILSRAEKKDYFDIAELGTRLDISLMLLDFQTRYGKELNLYAICKSLVYFEDIVETADPAESIRSWEEVQAMLKAISCKCFEELTHK